MKPLLKYTLFALLWGAVALYVIRAARRACDQRRQLRIERIVIEVTDSSSQGQLVTAGEVRRWLRQERLQVTGTAADTLDLTRIEQVIARNGFVERVAAFTTGRGEVHIAIRQRKPLLRLLTEGENAYVTAEGFVFARPQASSLYVPVVTGSYRPPFPAGYAGEARRWMESERQRIEAEIAQLELERIPVYNTRRDNQREYREVRNRRVKWWWKYLEDEEEYQTRINRMKADRAEALRRYRYRMRCRRQELEAIDAKVAGKRAEQKKLEKNYEDFVKLLTFVKSIEADDFWSAEVVQIVARTAPSGAIEVDLVPRSGRHIVRFGRLERIDEKFDKLMRFYRTGLSRIGWETWRVIDIRYKDQVVCRGRR